MRERPRVGISACLMGEAVRYDGRDKRAAALLEALGSNVELVAVCPEVEAGFGVPREPIHLAWAHPAAAASPSVAVVTESGTEVTARMTAASTRLARQAAAMRLAGFILKSRSPSCGLDDVPIAGAGLDEPTIAAGTFASALRQALPSLPMEDEVRLADPFVLERFLALVRAYHREDP